MSRKCKVPVINLGCSDSEDNLSLSPPNRRRRVTRSMSKKRGRPAKNTGRPNAEVIVMDDSLDIDEVSFKQERKKKTVVLEDGLEISIDDISDEEDEQCIRVLWGNNGEVNRFNLKPSDTLKSVFEHFSNKYNLPVEQIKIRKEDDVLSIYNTVASLQLKVTQALLAYAAQESTNECLEDSAGKIKIKCILKDSKKPLMFYLHPNQNFNCVLKVCAKEIGYAESHLRLKFDGELVKPSETPLSLDLEGDECFEVHLL